MDFGEILNRWEREGDGGREKGVKHRRSSELQQNLNHWLESHGVEDKDDGDESSAPSRIEEARRLAALEPQDSIDLHGLRAAEAAEELEGFLLRSSRAGLEKVLVVHGKGNHSAGEPVLGRVARRVIEASPLAGRFGVADRDRGGSGAMWVLLRKRA